MRAIALVDLDDTLFQTLGKCPGDVPPEKLVPVGYARDGAALSYSTPRQRNFLAWLSEGSLVVPVTARSRDALERVRIDWIRAVCAHGGVVLGSEGKADPGWRARMESEAAAYADALADLERRVVLEGQGEALRIRILEEEEGLPLHLLVKHETGDSASLATVIERVVPHVPQGWTVHRNGNNAALLPPFLGKQHAVAYLIPELRRRYPDAPVVGIGDSLTDAPFMALCDYAMMPTVSQLAAATLSKAA